METFQGTLVNFHMYFLIFQTSDFEWKIIFLIYFFNGETRSGVQNQTGLRDTLSYKKDKRTEKDGERSVHVSAHVCINACVHVMLLGQSWWDPAERDWNPDPAHPLFPFL